MSSPVRRDTIVQVERLRNERRVDQQEAVEREQGWIPPEQEARMDEQQEALRDDRLSLIKREVIEEDPVGSRYPALKTIAAILKISGVVLIVVMWLAWLIMLLVEKNLTAGLNGTDLCGAGTGKKGVLW